MSYHGGALILAVVGVPVVIWPYKIARFEERVDAIGSKRSWDEVEPTEWRVKLTRIVGIGMIVVGVAAFLS